ncbi:DUF4825 domain-containing protein [Niallia taxi]|uniref:DUF4825 domain-containing protein n=1 Tax=Niallia taxi TaxID=2499688 RepID=UPI002E227413|nr:DUF4825 domain-containing protein [Niallia taxi]MED4118589.1 DUF4825 domain-containing protein [Niallia taxi]
MQNLKMYLFASLTILLLLSGCNTKETNKDIFQYKDSYVGDNSAVGNIVYKLPGAQQLSGIELKTKEEPYGIILNYGWEKSKNQYKELVIYNTTFLFTLVKNVDWITVKSERKEYTVTKEDLQKWYGKDFSNIQTAKELRKLVQQNLSNEHKVSEFLD